MLDVRAEDVADAGMVEVGEAEQQRRLPVADGPPDGAHGDPVGEMRPGGTARAARAAPKGGS